MWGSFKSVAFLNSIMLDLAIGRPSRTYKKIQFIIPAIVAYYKVVKPFYQSKRNQGLTKFLIAVFLIYRCIRNLPLILGIDPPESHSGYSRDFYRATWITTAMDAGFWSCLKIKPKWLRDIASVLATAYYLVAYETATAKCTKFRAQPTVQMLSASWEKQKNWIFNTVIKLSLPTLGYTDVKYFPRNSEEWGYNEGDVKTISTKTHLYFSGSKLEFMNQQDIIFFIPGGGWLATDPTSHEQYIYDLCQFTNIPVVALDYLKAPKYPFPFALEECLAFYKQFVLSNGASIGMNPSKQRRRVIVLGDSAGGNLACGMVIRLILEDFTIPHHFIMMYPCLNLDLKCWLEPDQLDLLHTKELRSVNSFLDTNTGQHKRSKSFIITNNNEVNGNGHVDAIVNRRNKSFFDLSNKVTEYQQHRQENREPSIWAAFGNRYDIEDDLTMKQLEAKKESQSASTTSLKKYDAELNQGPATANYYLQRQDKQGHVALTSRICFFQDKILPAELMRALVLLYLKNSPFDPEITTNYVLSPLLCPDHILEKFPKVSILVGDRDPILDDSIIFSAKLRRAQKDQDAVQLTVIPGW